MDDTAGNTRMDLILALNYSGKADIIQSVKKIASGVKTGTIREEDISEEMLTNQLYTAGIPDPELMIRTSGEQRISNFLLWQLAYSEFYFTEKYWPDFDKEEIVSGHSDLSKQGKTVWKDDGTESKERYNNITQRP
jgi:undecaprenyl diphosphate synthase